MRKNTRKLLTIALALALLMSFGALGAPSLAAPPNMAAGNPFADDALVYSNTSFIWPGQAERLIAPNNTNPVWTNAAYRAYSGTTGWPIPIHDSGVYYENGWYYGMFTNDVGIYKSRDLLNWERSGVRPRGWRNNEPLYVTWAPELIKLKQPYVWPMDGSPDAGKSFAYALYDSVSLFGQQLSRIRVFVTNDPSPNRWNSAGIRATTNGGINATNLNSVANYGAGLATGAGTGDAYFKYVGDVMGSRTYATANPSDTYANNDGGSGNPRPAFESDVGGTAKYFVLQNHSANGTYDFNAIDSCTVYDQDGRMWMTWGSYTNGIWICEIDQATLLPLSHDASTYKRIARIGREEAPNIVYHENAAGQGYYYLCLGKDDIANSYNSRIGRSVNIDGPYLDYNGRDLVDTSTNNAYAGTKVAGPYAFDSNFPWYAQGHIQWIHNTDTDEWLIVSNGRSVPLSTNWQARLMVRSVLWTEDGWPLFSPALATSDITKSILDGSGNAIKAPAKAPAVQTVSTGLIPGTYRTYLHRRSNEMTGNPATTRPYATFTLNKDYTITGTINSATSNTLVAITTGFWAQTGPQQVMMEINGLTYEAVFNASWDWERDGAQGNGLTFAAISEAGTYTNDAYGAVLWGKQDPPTRPATVFTAATLTVPSYTIVDLTLPDSLVAAGEDVEVAWSSSNTAAIGHDGTVTRAASDVTATLTATLTYRGTYVETRTFNVTVGALPHIPVTGIIDVPDSVILGNDLTLTGTVEPNDATNQVISWSLVSDGGTGAVLTLDELSGITSVGTITVLATITDGLAVGTPYTEEFEIEVTSNINPGGHMELSSPDVLMIKKGAYAYVSIFTDATPSLVEAKPGYNTSFIDVGPVGGQNTVQCITAKKAGTTVLTFWAGDDGGAFKTIVVIVN